MKVLGIQSRHLILPLLSLLAFNTFLSTQVFAESSASKFDRRQNKSIRILVERVDLLFNTVAEGFASLGISTSSGPGATGSQGPSGPQGPSGDPGTPGAQGPTGSQGSQGPVGPQGPRGEVGPAGAQGPIGETGPRGAQGLPGAQGTAGATGSQGIPGPRGADGATGPRGADGANGSQGPVGPAGAIGPVGPIGPIGPQGPSSWHAMQDRPHFANDVSGAGFVKAANIGCFGAWNIPCDSPITGYGTGGNGLIDRVDTAAVADSAAVASLANQVQSLGGQLLNIRRATATGTNKRATAVCQTGYQPLSCSCFCGGTNSPEMIGCTRNSPPHGDMGNNTTANSCEVQCANDALSAQHIVEAVCAKMN